MSTVPTSVKTASSVSGSNGTSPTATAAVLKSKIFSADSKRLKSEVIPFHGVEIELRQATLGENIEIVANEDLMSLSGMHKIFLRHTFIPGTDEHLFDDTDIEQLNSLADDAEMKRVLDTWMKLSGIRIEDEVKNSVKTQSDSGS